MNIHRVTIPADRMAGRSLSPETLRTLTQVGMPAHVPDLFVMARGELPSLGRLHDVVTLGRDEGSWIVLDADEIVRSIPFDNALPERHVNASVTAFAAFLDDAAGLRVSIAQLSNAEAAVEVSAARDRLARMDPSAFSSDETWWAVIFEQLESGLL
jgi:SUKH-4 immunity protein